MVTRNPHVTDRFDGTWNDPQDRTNVFRLCTSLADHARDRGRQPFFYDPGVGTNRFTRLRGGLFGFGLSRHLRKGYDWLARHYAQGDRIFIFGFSRGAYTARSLVGLIRKYDTDPDGHPAIDLLPSLAIEYACNLDELEFYDGIDHQTIYR